MTHVNIPEFSNCPLLTPSIQQIKGDYTKII